MDAAVRLFAPMFGHATWNRQQAEGVLQDLLTAFAPLGAVLADLRFVTIETDNLPALRLYALRSKYSSEPPQEQEEEPAVYHAPSVGWLTVKRRRIITFVRDLCPSYRPICRDSKRVLCGIDAPFKFFANGHNVDGVISIDCERLVTWNPAMLRCISLAVRKLSWLASSNCPQHNVNDTPAILAFGDGRTARDRFLRTLKELPILRIGQVYLRTQNGWVALAESAENLMEDSQRIELFDKQLNEKENPGCAQEMSPHDRKQPFDPYEEQRRHYGMKTDESSPDRFFFPLYMNAALAGCVAGLYPPKVGFDPSDPKEDPSDQRETEKQKHDRLIWGATLNEALSRITDAWNIFANSVQGVLQDWQIDVAHTEKDSEPGMEQWTVHPTWLGPWNSPQPEQPPN